MMATPAAAQSDGPGLDVMAGQMILSGFAGDSVAATSEVADLIAAGKLGGVMYLKTNASSLDAIKAMNAAFRAARPDLPPFIALDQEGGMVERLTSAIGFGEIASAADIASSTDPLGAEEIYAGMASGLKSAGFTVNFGPVVDLNLNTANPVIARYGRSFGADAEGVAAYAGAFVAAHRRAGVLTALKHFPGHGSSSSDSHEGFVDITRTWQPVELEPFRRMIAAGDADMVMVAHLYHAKFGTDPAQRLPSSLSPSWIEGVLRAQLGFEGVVVTDDLEMGAIRQHFTLAESVIAAVRAGADILLFSNTVEPRLSLADDVQKILVDEAERNPAFKARIAESFARIVALKRRL